MSIRKLLSIFLFLWILAPSHAQVVIDKRETISNDTLKVEILVDGFVRISAFQMGFTFDTFGLQFINAEFADLPSFNSGSLNVNGDLISLLWFENQTNGETLADGSALISLKYKILFPFYGPVHLSNCPLEIEIFDVSLSMLDVESDILNDSRCPAITGKVFLDLAYDCTYNAGSDPAAEAVSLKVISPAGVSYVQTDKDGNFKVQGPKGTYRIQLVPPDKYWNPCDTLLTLVVSSGSRQALIGLQAAYPCPMMEVNIPETYISGCHPHAVNIQYRNIGTIPVNAAQIAVGLDSGFQILSADLPYTLDSGKYIFEAPAILESLQSGSFEIRLQPNCAFLGSGKEFCIEASVSPAAFCRAPGMGWDGSNLSLRGACLDSLATFRIENGGSDMTEETPVYIFRNDIVVERRFIQLESFANETIELESQGTRVSVLVSQHPAFPYEGILYVSVDNCEGIPSASEHPFRVGDPLPFNASSCITYRPELPAEKLWTTYTPLGYGADHTINREMEITVSHKLALPAGSGTKKLFMTSFLDSNIDPLSFTLGALDFPYTFTSNGAELTLRLYPPVSQDTIIISYSYMADPSIVPGTEIENSVTFFLQDGSQLGSIVVQHQIDTSYLEAGLSAADQALSLPGVRVFPNPGTDVVTIDWEHSNANAFLMDMYGRTILRSVVYAGLNEMRLQSIPSGVYFLYLYDAISNRPLAIQKLVRK